ncbi:putative RING-H2 finger protein ATL53 [Henckelia pumila]|uniref:putative RING-H2 finger protein ATL53 n=1 Tax=Henckelia pumila TaxID=405737 RepID=UPI003C6DCD12
MAFHLRKLLDESEFSEAVAQFCESSCAATPIGLCPPKCLDLCITNCIDAKYPFPPPPPPPEISGGYSSPGHTSRLSLFLVIALAILVTCFFLFSCYTIYKFFNLNWNSVSRRRRELRRRGGEELGPNDFLDAEQGPVVDHYLWYIRTVGLEPSVISKIAIVKYKKGDGLVESTDCAVCLNEFQEDETLRLLPKCSHAFHLPCIDTWLSSHTNCPVCRAGIVNNTAVIPSEELVVQNSVLAEGTSREVGRGSEEDQASELRIGIGDENELGDVIGLKLDDANGGLGEIQPRRMSVSMDSLSASMISDAISNAFPGQSNRDSVETKESDVGMVAGREGSNEGLLTGSSSITRSISCNARLFLSRYACGTPDSVIRR